MQWLGLLVFPSWRASREDLDRSRQLEFPRQKAREGRVAEIRLWMTAGQGNRCSTLAGLSGAGRPFHVDWFRCVVNPGTLRAPQCTFIPSSHGLLLPLVSRLVSEDFLSVPSLPQLPQVLCTHKEGLSPCSCPSSGRLLACHSAELVWGDGARVLVPALIRGCYLEKEADA